MNHHADLLSTLMTIQICLGILIFLGLCGVMFCLYKRGRAMRCLVVLRQCKAEIEANNPNGPACRAYQKYKQDGNNERYLLAFYRSDVKP